MESNVRIIDLRAGYGGIIAEAAGCLASGGLVIFPTETVYGVGASVVHAGALARLRQVKQREGGKPFTVHVGSRSMVERFVPELTGYQRHLIERAFPGPVTLVFPVEQPDQTPIVQEFGASNAGLIYHQGTVGIRCPEDVLAADLLRQAGVPVVAASANEAGSLPPVDGQEAIEALGAVVDLVLDAGRTRYAKASTVVKLDRFSVRVLREGVLDMAAIQRLASMRFLLVCAGNTCRSPMAEVLLRQILAQAVGCTQEQLIDRGFAVESAGLSGYGGMPASGGAVRAMGGRGLDLTAHRSRGLGVEAIQKADWIFTMTAGQLRAIRELVPEAAARCRTLDDEDIADPIGGTDEEYMHCAQAIERALQRRVQEVVL